MKIPDCTELGQNRIMNSQTINFLGLTVDYKLSWSPHIARICSKLRSACYILRILKPTLTTQNLKTIYFAYFHSILSYGIIFWGNSTGNEIFKLQKRAIRIMTIPETGHPVAGFSRSWVFCPFVPNKYYHSLCLLSKIWTAS